MASTSDVDLYSRESSFPSNPLWPVYRNYYTYLKDDGKNFRVKCKLCEPREIILSTAKSSSANLKKHLERRHFFSKSKLNENLRVTFPKRRSAEALQTEDLVSKYGKVSRGPELSGNSSTLSQDELDKLVTEFIVAGNHPLNTVEEENFCKILNAGFPNLNVITKGEVMNNITTGAKRIKEDLNNCLKSQAVKHVALSVDCWSFNSRKYIGIIAHWLNDKLKRHSSAIALRSLKRQLVHDMLAEIILQVCHEYGIQKKVVSIVSDSASNLNRSFSILGKIEDSEWEEEDGCKVDEDNIDIEPILEDENNEFLPLPMHHRCVCHSLDLIVTEDAHKAEFSACFRNQKKITLTKCLAFWKKQSRSIHVPDMIKEIVGCYLKVPNMTCWQSVHNAMENLAVVMQNKYDSLNLVCDYLEIPHYTETDVLFVKEYAMVMQPIYKATNTLQQDKDMHMGCLLPTLTCLKRRLQDIERESMQYCHSLATACLNGINMRFGDMLNDRSFLMAALTHPKFKLKWIESKDKKDDALLLLKQEIRQRSSDQVNLWSGVIKKENTEILFEDYESSAYDHELEMFLSNAVKDVQCLNSVPILKDMFITYNTSLPSSRCVKKLFSVTGELQKQKCVVYDQDLEDTLIYRFNISLS